MMIQIICKQIFHCINWAGTIFLFRPYGPDHYLAEAKRLKHKADSSVSISNKFTIFWSLWELTQIVVNCLKTCNKGTATLVSNIYDTLCCSEIFFIKNNSLLNPKVYNTIKQIG